jgi:hypothetical protein
MAQRKNSSGKNAKRVTRYTYDEVKEPRTPERGHTSLLPADEQVVTLPMDNGWSKAIEIGKLPEGDERPVVVDMDPGAFPRLGQGYERRDCRHCRQGSGSRRGHARLE